MPPHLLRLAYVAEFLLALIAILVLWTQVGGQNHLDFMPWYYKLFLSLATSYAIVRATISSVSSERAWNWHTVVWVMLIVFLMIGMASVTYYYHLQEEDSDEDGNDVAAFVLPRSERLHA